MASSSKKRLTIYTYDVDIVTSVEPPHHSTNGERNIASVYVDGLLIASGSSENKENAILHAAEAAVSKITRSKADEATMGLQTVGDSGGSTEINKHIYVGERNIASVYVDGLLIASGSSENKENARLHAAEAAVSKITRSKADEATMGLQIVGDSRGSTEIEFAKQKVHELCNKKRWPNPIYKVEKESGPAHEKKYVSSVQVEISDRILLAEGEEKSRVKEAENSAASMMYCALRESGYI